MASDSPKSEAKNIVAAYEPDGTSMMSNNWIMEPSGERSVKPKVTMEYRNTENLDEFIMELKGIYLEIEMSKKDADEELTETKRNFLRFMEKYNTRIQRELILS